MQRIYHFLIKFCFPKERRGLGSAILGKLADSTSISYVFHVCAFLPLIDILTTFLPNIEVKKKKLA